MPHRSRQPLRKVAVAVLNWNGRRHLEICLEALDGQLDPGVDWEVLVLDNASTDDSWSWLQRAWPKRRKLGVGRRARLHVSRSERNLGFCEGNNLLIEGCDADAVALLNNDTRPDPAWLAQLVEALGSAPADVAAVSGLIVDWEGERLDFAQGAMTFDGHAFQRGYHRPLAESELPPPGSELLFACGGNMAVRRDSFLAAGGFDSDFFAYLEDVDLGWRLWAGGERVILAPYAVVHHRSMATSQLLGLYNRGFLFERNAFLTAFKNYDAELWPRMMPAVLLTLIARTQTLLVENNPHAEQLTLDPYHPDHAAAMLGEPPRPGLLEKWRGWGTRELARRGVRKLRRQLARWLDPDIVLEAVPRLEDPRTVAQLRVLTYLLSHLDEAADKRQRAQSRRALPDRDLFERFPLLVVPTYPGDERLFKSRAFNQWLPGDIAIERCTLDQLMALDD